MQRLSTMLALCFAATPALAEKSNEVRPTPSPITHPTLKAGGLILSPSVVYANYKDRLDVQGLPGVTQQYDIRSVGVLLEAQTAVLDWLILQGSLETYRKLGVIQGPSPGAPLTLVEADVLGYAVKLGGQVTVRLLGDGLAEAEPSPLAFSLYAYGGALADVFHQTQEEPFSETDFDERSLTYRAGLAANVHLASGFFLAPFGGIEGVRFSGERRDRLAGAAETKDSLGGGDGPYPYVGGDLLWAPVVIGGSFDQALSLAAIYALAGDDETGYGGKLLTLSVGYTFKL